MTTAVAHSGHASPSRISAASTYANGVKSLPFTTLRAWRSFLFAPVTHEVPGATRGSA